MLKRDFFTFSVDSFIWELRLTYLYIYDERLVWGSLRLAPIIINTSAAFVKAPYNVLYFCYTFSSNIRIFSMYYDIMMSCEKALYGIWFGVQYNCTHRRRCVQPLQWGQIEPYTWKSTDKTTSPSSLCQCPR